MAEPADFFLPISLRCNGSEVAVGEVRVPVPTSAIGNEVGLQVDMPGFRTNLATLLRVAADRLDIGDLDFPQLGPLDHEEPAGAPESKRPARPAPALIEIIERNVSSDDVVILVPNEVRINGIPLLVPEGQSIKVHELQLSDQEAVCVTLTLFARRVTVAAEGDLSEGSDATVRKSGSVSELKDRSEAGGQVRGGLTYIAARYGDATADADQVQAQEGAAYAWSGTGEAPFDSSGLAASASQANEPDPSHA